MEETTFAIVKPDARGKAPEIIVKATEAGFKVVHSKVLTMTTKQARSFYAEHHGKNFFDGLVEFMTSGECIVLALQKENAVKDWRAFIGPTNSETARQNAPDSIRAIFGNDGRRNAVHGSASVSAAHVELSFFFPKYYLYQRTVACILPNAPAGSSDTMASTIVSWGFTTIHDYTVQLDEKGARDLAEKWAAERPYEFSAAEDDGSFILPYNVRPHPPEWDIPPAEKKVAAEGEEPPPEEEAPKPVDTKPVAPETTKMNVDKMVAVLLSGPIELYLLGRMGGIHALQVLTGPQEPAVARFHEAEIGGTFRAHFGASRENFAIHASEGPEAAKKDIATWFPKYDEVETTFAIIKPDAVSSGNADTIRQMIKINGFQILEDLAVQMTGEMADRFYEMECDKPDYPDLKAFITGGKCIALVLKRVNASSMWKALCGHAEGSRSLTNADRCKAELPHSLCALFGTDSTRNAVHACENADRDREIDILLPDYHKHQTTLAILKPDLTGPGRHAIMKRIRDEGFFVQNEKRMTLSFDEAKAFYSNPDSAQGADIKKASELLSSGPSIALVLSRPNAIRHWLRVIGPNNAKTARETDPASLRAEVAKGTDDIRNGLHGSDKVVSGARETAFFFPRMVRTVKPPPGQLPAAQFVEAELQPTLTKALTQLCKEKPPDPLRWLAQWILNNNPNKPRVELPPRVESKKHKVPQGSKLPFKSNGGKISNDVVFILSASTGQKHITENTAVQQAKLLCNDYGFAHISFTDLVNEEIRSMSEAGAKLKSIQTLGQPAPADIAMAMICQAMVLTVGNKIVFTGFPQSIDQVRRWEQQSSVPPTVLHLTPTEGITVFRSGADAEDLQKLDSFEEHVSPVIAYFTKKKNITEVPYTMTQTTKETFTDKLQKKFFATKEKHIIYIMGPDAVGRSAVASKIADSYDFRHINLGALMTDELIAKSDVGAQISACLKGKRAVPTSLVVDLVKNAVMKDNTKNFVIDGFPMNIDELGSFEKAVGMTCDGAVFLKCDDATVADRIAKDSSETSIIARSIHDARGASGLQDGVLRHLKENCQLVEVDGGQSVDDVYSDTEGKVLIGHFKMRSKKVFVLGGPGSGKGTQCQLLVEKYGFVHLSAGDLLRDEVKSGSANGAMISEMIRQGAIVPAEVTVGLLKAAMEKTLATKFLIDGFPRDLDNVRAWETSLGNPEFVLFVDCTQEEMERRLLKRGETSGRADDNAKTIIKRFKTFVEQSMPVLDLYERRGLVKKVSSMGSVTQVFNQVQRCFGAFTPIPEIVFVLGGPGVGKGTQCERIQTEYGFEHLSAGDLLRAEVKRGSKNGAMIAEIIREGKIVPQEVTIKLLVDAMAAKPGGRFLIDGFPRAMDQAVSFEQAVGLPKFVLSFDAPDDLLVQRLLKRGETSGRSDDNEEAIKKRLFTYHSQSEPVIAAYQAKGMVRKISSVAGPDQVFKEVEKVFASFRKRQLIYVLGQPLGGKTLLCQSLARTGEFTHIEVSDLLKGQVKSGSDIGRQIAAYVKSGKKVPTEMIVSLISAAVQAQTEQSGKLLLDGFPRSFEEHMMLVAAIGKPVKAIYLDCSAHGGIDVMVHRNAIAPQSGMDAATSEVKMRERYATFEEGIGELTRSLEADGLLSKIPASSVDEDEKPHHEIHGSRLTYEACARVLGL